MLAGPLSLAATKGISVDFFSSGYLDGSVPRVRLIILWIQIKITSSKLVGFPHSEIPGSKLVCQLPEAYRRLLRPSSPVAAVKGQCPRPLDDGDVFGGARRDRTADLCNAIAALSQLSYSPARRVILLSYCWCVKPNFKIRLNGPDV